MSGNGKEKKMKQIVLVAETGSDINPVLAAEYNIKIVPMHVSFDHETMEDGAFPVEKIVDYYEETGRLPKTSGSTPGDLRLPLTASMRNTPMHSCCIWHILR